MLDLQTIGKKIANLSPRERLIFNLSAAFVFLVILDRTVISPIFSQIEALNKETRQEEAAIKKNLRLLAQKDKILAQSSKFESYLNSSLSQDEEVTAMLKEIEDLANKNSVYLVDLKPGDIKQSGATKKYLINLSLEAQMDQLAVFMYGVESSDRLFTIEKYQIEPKSRESSVARCTMIISRVAPP
ncbi:MAG: type 4a pilus biogenesis protein PilO [Candidatus Omnitrophica bacterium]|nr:type 4a pilus biogenesis protein PilO [Candidatus Omnitrophota bacterium]